MKLQEEAKERLCWKTELDASRSYQISMSQMLTQTGKDSRMISLTNVFIISFLFEFRNIEAGFVMSGDLIRGRCSSKRNNLVNRKNKS